MNASPPQESAPPSIRYASSSAGPSIGAWSWLRIMLGIGLAVAGSLYFGRVVNQSLPEPPLPVVARIDGDLQLTERSGQTVKLSSLRGKVTVMACLYTVCPHGCAAVVGEMKKLHDAHHSRPDFHLVSLAVAPERDTPQFLQAYAEGVGVKPGEPWWFVTGPQQATWDYMTQQLLMQVPKPIPEPERINPLDLYEHDLRLVLVDRQGRVRGYYSVFHPQPEIARLMTEKLGRDVQRLLDHPEL
ncbi:MAG: SCO family protein [Prosthecobacter sp.]|jgi:cytochrome oxidase Cu insertion factor (SCO1/SenC/PrrC family)|uniref:SCO family protein n=1 Tax=Prosthecobacter sp. TaxID=1965333 RepID=UPI0019D8AB57|nr:SCO family protein [Prosthecobacter sp.]MBE2284786.1 SCO family protein [Prosthecobacter sp.]